jgi:CBS domain-containing protein
MQLKEFVNPRVETVQADATLQSAAEKMRQLDVGSLPVCQGNHLVGMITDRDITIRAVAIGSDPAKAMVHEAMTPDVVCCSVNDEVEEAARIMQDNQVRRILVVNEANELIGITSIGEVATATGDRMLAGETLLAVSESFETGTGPAQDEVDLDDEEDPGDALSPAAGTRVTGILHDREATKKAVEGLKSAGFSERSIFIAMEDESEQQSLAEETGAQAMAAEEIPSLPDFGAGRVLIMIDAEERADEALNILNSNHAVTGGTRTPAD